MLTWILYDTKFGNGKKLAEMLKGEFPESWNVKTGDVKSIKPSEIAQEVPDVLVLGGAIRMFRGAPASKKWLKELSKVLRSNGKNIPKATVFMTHGLPTDKIQGFANRFLSKLTKANIFDNVYSKSLTTKVADTEGPIIDSELEKAMNYINEFIDWEP